MLKTTKFSDLQKGIDKISEFIETKTGPDVKFEKEIKEKKRRKTWFLDTNTHSLNEKNKFLLRVRKEVESDEYEMTLKCRHPDRYLSASYDLSSHKKNIQFKFEEDISIPFISNFSHSASFQERKMPDLTRVKDLLYIFPNLILKDILETDTLIKVNNFEPYEISYKIGTLDLTEKREVDLYLNLWYLEDKIKNYSPSIVEFTFNYEARDSSEKNTTLLEEFSPTIVRKTNSFYHWVQDDEIADLHTTKTKTQFAYKKHHNR